MSLYHYMDACAKQPTDKSLRFNETEAEKRSGLDHAKWQELQRQALEMGLISCRHGNGAEMPRGYYRITPRGWNQVNPRLNDPEAETGIA